VLKRHRNATVVMGDVTHIDLAARTIAVSQAGERRAEVAYDTLVVAAGARHSYFGNDHWAAHAPG